MRIACWVAKATDTHSEYVILIAFPRQQWFYEISWKNVVETERTHAYIIWRMRIACWVAKATDTHSEYVILIAFPRHQWLRENATMLRLRTLLVLVFLSFFLSFCHRLFLFFILRHGRSEDFFRNVLMASLVFPPQTLSLMRRGDVLEITSPLSSSPLRSSVVRKDTLVI